MVRVCVCACACVRVCVCVMPVFVGKTNMFLVCRACCYCPKKKKVYIHSAEIRVEMLSWHCNNI